MPQDVVESLTVPLRTAAETLGLKTKMLRALIKAGEFPALRIPSAKGSGRCGRVRILKTDLEEALHRWRTKRNGEKEGGLKTPRAAKG